MNQEFNDYQLLVFQVSWVCLLCQKKQEMLTKTGNWFGSITASEKKPNSDSDLQLGSDFRAIPTEEDKRAMRRQGSLQRSDSGRGSSRRAKGRPDKDSERNRFRRPSVSDEEVDSLHETPPGSPTYLSDDELYRQDENKVRRKVVKFKGHDELDHHAPQGRLPGTMPNMQKPGPLNQGPGRGVVAPGQAPRVRPGQPQLQGPGARPGSAPVAPQGRGMPGPGSQPGMRPNFAPQQQPSSFTPVGHPGTPPSSRGALPAPQQQSPRGAVPPNQARPGYGMRGPPGQQQPRFQAPPQQNAVGYGRGAPPGSQPGAPPHGQMDGKPGYGRGGPPVSQPGNQQGPRPGGPVPGQMDNRPRQPGSFPPNHVGAPQLGPGSPRPGDRMGPQQGPRPGAPPGMMQTGPRFGAGGQPRPGMPVDQHGGQHQHPGQLGSPRQNQVPDQLRGQVGSPRQGPPGDQQPRGQIGAPRAGPPVDQVRAPMGSPRLGSPRNQTGAPQQGPFPDQGRGQLGSSMDQTRGRMGPGPVSQEPRVDQSKAPYGTQQQPHPLDQPRGQFGPSQQQPPITDQGRPRVGSAGPLLDQSRRQQAPDTRNGYSPEVQNTGVRRFPEQNAPGSQQRTDSRNGHMPDDSTVNGRIGPSFSNRQERPEQRSNRQERPDQRSAGGTDPHGMMGQSSRPMDRPGYQGGQSRPYNEDIDGRRSPPRKISLDEPNDKVGHFQLAVI